MRVKIRIWAFVMFGVMLGAQLVLGQTRWQPFKLHPDVKYLKLEYQVTVGNKEPMDYTIEIKRLPYGKLDVSITHKAKIQEDQLGAQTLVGIFSVYGISAISFFNPAYAIFLSQMDLKVGEKMSFFGAGYGKVTGEKTVGGRKGFVVEFYQRNGDKDQLASRSVIDPKIFIPIENEMFDANGDVQSHIVLIKSEVK